MKRAKIGQLKNQLSRFLDQVKKGETVLVLDRKTPIARIVPFANPSQLDKGEAEAWLRRLEQQGALRLGRRKGVIEIASTAPPGRKPVGAVKALLEERDRR
jgi:antitoxin (DNA-binding transcriptional repressor) of toxin-antitoxin stability system